MREITLVCTDFADVEHCVSCHADWDDGGDCPISVAQASGLPRRLRVLSAEGCCGLSTRNNADCYPTRREWAAALWQHRRLIHAMMAAGRVLSGEDADHAAP